MAKSKSAPVGRPYTQSETVFNADLREVLRMCAGFSALHVREADLPGVFDLLVTEKRAAGSSPRPLRFLWIELKIGNEEVRPSQVTFNRERAALGEVLIIARLVDDRALTLAGPDCLAVVPNFLTFDWDRLLKEWLDSHFS